ncbi:MAG: CPBP family intramembrane glutamic endopeptidase [Polaribacter sp.]|uniref:CPBP family intramembrane glutamic endopeptidase n=1 Tax=Polaribacter sp. TaxID=1920175 RepID=UPI0032674A55
MKKTELMIVIKIMKKSNILKQIVVFTLFIISILILKTSTAKYLLSIDINDYNTQTISKIFFNLLLIIGSVYLIRKEDLFKTGGLTKVKVEKPLLLVFPLIYLVLLNLLIPSEIPAFNFSNILILTLYCISIGFAEELSIRSVLLPLILKFNNGSKMKAVLFSSLIFGALHLIHFNKGIPGEISQLFFATFIGFMFGALLLITKRIYPLIIIHAIIDFVAKLDSLGKPIKETVYDPMDIESAIFTVILVLPCLIYGLIIFRKYSKKDEYKTE